MTLVETNSWSDDENPRRKPEVRTRSNRKAAIQEPDTRTRSQVLVSDFWFLILVFLLIATLIGCREKSDSLRSPLPPEASPATTANQSATTGPGASTFELQLSGLITDDVSGDSARFRAGTTGNPAIVVHLLDEEPNAFDVPAESLVLVIAGDAAPSAGTFPLVPWHQNGRGSRYLTFRDNQQLEVRLAEGSVELIDVSPDRLHGRFRASGPVSRSLLFGGEPLDDSPAVIRIEGEFDAASGLF